MGWICILTIYLYSSQGGLWPACHDVPCAPFPPARLCPLVTMGTVALALQDTGRHACSQTQFLLKRGSFRCFRRCLYGFLTAVSVSLAAITKCHRWGLKQQGLIFHGSGGCRSTPRVLAIGFPACRCRLLPAGLQWCAGWEWRDGGWGGTLVSLLIRTLIPS